MPMLSQIRHRILKYANDIGRSMMLIVNNLCGILYRMISNFVPIKLHRIVLLESYAFTVSINLCENLFACQLFSLLRKENYIIHLRIQQNLRENETRFRDVNCLNAHRLPTCRMLSNLNFRRKFLLRICCKNYKILKMYIFLGRAERK